MAKQKIVSTSIGEIIVSPLSIAEVRQLHDLLALAKAGAGDMACLLKAVPLILANARKAHQNITTEAMEAGLTVQDLGALIVGVLDVSGMHTRYSRTTPTGDTRQFH